MSRDRTVEDTFYLRFSTKAFSTGVPTTLSGTPVVSAYEDNSTTQITTGITLGVDHDSVTGLNLLTIVATGANGFESGKDYDLVITTGTVDSVSVVSTVVGHFSLSLSAATVNVNSLNDISTAQVNTEVLDVLTVDTFAELSSVPAATSSILSKLNWLFALGRNKVTQTATTQTLRNDADTSSIATATVADDGTTTTRDEYS